VDVTLYECVWFVQGQVRQDLRGISGPIGALHACFIVVDGVLPHLQVLSWNKVNIDYLNIDCTVLQTVEGRY